MEIVWEFSQKKSQEKGPLAEKWWDKKSKMTRQKNMRGDRKGDSNDSPEIPDKGRHQTSPASLWGKPVRV